MKPLTTSRRITTLAMLAAAGIALFALESLVPLPLPFLKIGLANVSTIVALMLFGIPEACTVVVVRVVAGSLLTGSLLGPGFLLALSGGLVSALIMGLVHDLTRGMFSVIGISLVGSVSHVCTQLAIVTLLFVHHLAVLYLLPLLLFSALVGGLIVGLFSHRVLRVMRSLGWTVQ